MWMFLYLFRYRVWHYSGVLLEQQQIPKGEELWEGFWQPAPDGKYPEKAISYRQVQSAIPELNPAGKLIGYNLAFSL